MPITRNGKGASLAPALPRLNAANSTTAASRYSVSKDDLNTEMVDGDEALTTSGRTYEELVASLHHQRESGSMAAGGSLRDFMMSDKTEESESSPSHNDGRQSVGVMLGRNLNTWSTGRNSLSNWSTIGGGGGGGETPGGDNDGIDDNTESRIPSSVHIGGLDTGRKSNISIPSLGGGRNSLETPSIVAAHVNISHRNVNSRTTQRSNIGSARVPRPSSLNMSHISSSSSSGLLEASGEMLEDECWTPIRTSLENSFDNTAPSNKKTSSSSLGGFKSSGRSLSPIRGRSSTSPKRSPVKSKSPVRSPFGDVSPNRSPTHSPKKKIMSPKKGSMTLPKKKLSPNGTYSLKEAEGKRLSMPASRTSTVTTNVDSGSGGSSNMSVSSGSDAAMTSGVTLERRTSSTKLVLPSLSTSRKSMNEKAAATAVADAEKILTNLSPVMTSTRSNVRSPVPTPNSQRKVVKRFRASVPSANYLNQDDLADTEEMVIVIAKPAGTSDGVANDMEVDTTTAKYLSYENAFVFPSDSIPKPSIKTLREFHDQAVAVGTPSHQYQLNCASSNIMSLHEVILPAIAYEMSIVLRHMQAKAQRNVKDGMPASRGQEVVEAIETCRRLVAKCNYEAVKVAGETWRDQEATREKLRMERLERDVEQQRLETRRAKRERKEARARSRQERYERQKSDKQRNHPRNKELWQEILKLTGDIQKLEKEERLWKEASVEVKDMEDNLQAPERQNLDSLLGKETGNNELVESVANANLESVATTLVGDVTMATERINWMLKSVSLAMDESDKLRKEAYDKYQNDGHKFVGYPKIDDPKGLFMALSMESPYKQ